jgi:hypothetical protein
VLAYAANSYFDALEGDDGKIAAFADDCVQHENGYQTVNNPPPGGRMMPAPPLPNSDTPQGKEQLRFSMLTVCAADRQQDIRVHETHPAAARDDRRSAEGCGDDVRAIRTRRHSMRRRCRCAAWNADERNDRGKLRHPRGGKIHEVEAMPFVTIPYGLGDGWTEGSGR